MYFFKKKGSQLYSTLEIHKYDKNWRKNIRNVFTKTHLINLQWCSASFLRRTPIRSDIHVPSCPKLGGLVTVKGHSIELDRSIKCTWVPLGVAPRALDDRNRSSALERNRNTFEGTQFRSIERTSAPPYDVNFKIFFLKKSQNRSPIVKSQKSKSK